MKPMKIAVLAAGLLGLAAGVSAQDKDALTISGSVKPRTQYSLSDGTGYANLSSGPGGQSYIKFVDKISPNSSLVLKFGTPYLNDKSGSAYDSEVAASNSWLSGVGIQEAYGATDILGELGANQLVGLKFQAGMFRLKAPVFSRGMNFGLGTGDEGSRSEVFGLYTFDYPGASYEAYKWSLEVPVNALKNVFPLSVKIGSDLDLTGKSEKTGLTAYAEVSGKNLYLADDAFVADWAVYYTYKKRDAATGSATIDGGQVVGGVFDFGFGFENGLSVGLGGAFDLAAYSYTAAWGGTATLRDYKESRLNWQAGADVGVKDLIKTSGAYIHRNAFSIDSTGSNVPYDYAQDYVAFRADCLVIKNLTPYFGGTYVLANKVVLDPIILLDRGSAAAGDKFAWEAGLMWNLTPSVSFDCGYTRGKNNALATFGAVINAIEQSQGGAIFARAGWKF